MTCADESPLVPRNAELAGSRAPHDAELNTLVTPTIHPMNRQAFDAFLEKVRECDGDECAAECERRLGQFESVTPETASEVWYEVAEEASQAAGKAAGLSALFSSYPE